MTRKPINSDKDSEGKTVNIYEAQSGAREYYADGIQGVHIREGICKFNLITDLVGHEDTGCHKEIVCTIVMPASQIRAIGEVFTKIAEQLSLPLLPKAPEITIKKSTS